MKRVILFLLVAVAGKSVSAQYKPVDNGSAVQFKVKNFGFSVDGSFTGLTGTVLFDPAQPANAAFDISIDANSVNTDNTMRDEHLRKPTYFDVKNYPRIKLESVKINAAGKKGGFLFSGKLTIRNHTKDISFPFTAEASGGGYLFKGSFTINRKDFEVGGTSTISDNLEVSLSVLAR
ncbi:MAG TPA: YceI family protein [Puia sp.]|nr:YceI family protein [Puia sp.]